MIEVRPYDPAAPLTPGFYDMTAAQYHADPCPQPSLSASIGRLLAFRSPLHAQRAHPRLFKQTAPDSPTRDMCIGSAVHALALGKGAEVVEIPFDDYKKKEAQEARDTAFGRGRIPILTPDMKTVDAMWRPMRNAIVRLVGEDHLSEVVGVYQDQHDGTWRRFMVDAMSRDGAVIVDAKTTGNAEPGAFAKHFITMGYDFNEVFYRDGLEALAPCRDRRFYFVAQEREFPEAITVHDTDPATREIAGRDVNRAYTLWAHCLKSGAWPPYRAGAHTILAPAWRIRDLEMSDV